MIDPGTKKPKKNVIDKMNDVSSHNASSLASEAMAKKDSVVAATRSALFGKDKVDQRRAGNLAANETRKKAGIPTVSRKRQINLDEGEEDKYSEHATKGHSRSKDSYSRDGKLEKNFDRTTNSAMKNAMAFAGVKPKK